MVLRYFGPAQVCIRGCAGAKEGANKPHVCSASAYRPGCKARFAANGLNPLSFARTQERKKHSLKVERIYVERMTMPPLWSKRAILAIGLSARLMLCCALFSRPVSWPGAGAEALSSKQKAAPGPLRASESRRTECLQVLTMAVPTAPLA
ncbi:hypothetical protein SHAL103562_05960 [Shewanella algae]